MLMRWCWCWWQLAQLQIDLSLVARSHHIALLLAVSQSNEAASQVQ
jgi:hypothetical protein